MKLKKAGIITKAVIIALVIYALTSLVTVRGRVAEAEREKQALEEQVSQILQSNGELQHQIDRGAQEEAIEEIARNKLGLVYPGERIFYDISD